MFDKGEYAAAYSGFEGADRAAWRSPTGCARAGSTRSTSSGIATDHCVRATALDAVARGVRRPRVLLDLSAGVAPETTERALAELRVAGVTVRGDER